MTDRRARLRDAIANGVDPTRLPGLEPTLDRIELVLDELDEYGLPRVEDALVDAIRAGVEADLGPFEPSLARRGLDLLLAAHPHLELVTADWQGWSPAGPVGAVASGPWLLVWLGQRSGDGADAFALYRFAIFKATGAVHGFDPDNPGAVTDDPILEP